MGRIGRLATAALAAGLFAGIALAQGFGPPQRRGGHGAGPGMRMAMELGLSDAQREEMRAAVERYRQGELGESERAAREARRELERLVRDPAAEESAVIEAAGTLAAAEQTTAVLRHAMAVEMNALLDDEQRAKAAELRERWAEMGPRRHHHGPDHGGFGPDAGDDGDED
jgi:Spy/CpxP family protein refolding chaperone